MKVLMLTVGGSDAPIIETLRHHKPDYIVFFCTEDITGSKGSRNMIEGQGLVCQERACEKCGYKQEDRTSIISRIGFHADHYEIVIVEADNPYDCYEKATLAIQRFFKQGDKILVDYTGGTKSMTVGLAVASMEYPDCEIGLVTGKRLDLVKIRDGMERVTKLSVNVVYITRQMALFERLVKRWDYQAGAKVLEDISGSGYVSDANVFERSLYLCRAFAAWDNFDYKAAVPLIELFKNESALAPYNAVLKKISATLDWYQKGENTGRLPGYDLVYDLLLNAERRSEQGNYDDAIARIYRALEMYAQFCLRSNTPSLNSDDIDVENLPIDIRNIYEPKRDARNKVQLPLAGSYELLERIGHPVGQVWKAQKGRVLNVLEKRNYSFLAHGMHPLGESDFYPMFNEVGDFIKSCDTAVGNKRGLGEALQLPRALDKAQNGDR